MVYPGQQGVWYYGPTDTTNLIGVPRNIKLRHPVRMCRSDFVFRFLPSAAGQAEIRSDNKEKTRQYQPTLHTENKKRNTKSVLWNIRGRAWKIICHCLKCPLFLFVLNQRWRKYAHLETSCFMRTGRLANMIKLRSAFRIFSERARSSTYTVDGWYFCVGCGTVT